MSTCLELKNSTSSAIDWQPSASIEALRARAYIIHLIRKFFAAHEVMEVETPLLAHSSATDAVIHSFTVEVPGQPSLMYLQTSPEFAMKRLLAAGSGAIYQICKAFRQDESGQRHNPEFTMLEWYRPGFSYTQLMDEVDLLIQTVLPTAAIHRWTYLDLFSHYLNINPFTANTEELKTCASTHGVNVHFETSDRDDWLNLLMSHLIEPQLQASFVYDYPASQAALSQIRKKDNYLVAERFELYINGMEIANGYHELCDAKEQEQRFIQDNLKREALGLAILPIDYRLIAALKKGLTECSGVALGIDRLVMLVLESKTIADVLSFSIHNA